jgi:heptosyltransferase-3
MKILLINLKHLGDVILTTPVVGALKTRFPDSCLTMVVDKGMEDAVSGHPLIHEVLALERKESFFPELTSQWRLIRRLRAARFDLAVEAGAGDRGALLAFLSGARRRIGFIPLRKKYLLRALLFTDRVPDRSNFQHTVLHHLDLLSPLHIRPETKEVHFGFDDRDRQKAEQFLKALDPPSERPFVLIHPTSRWMFKSWTPEGYARVARYFHQVLGWEVVLTCAPAENEKAFLEKIKALSSVPLLDLGGRLTLRELGALIAHPRCRLFFGPDTAPMHIAAAMKKPTVALFGPSGEHMWGPWGEGHLVIEKGWSCRPCGKAGCEDTGVSRCLAELTAEEVLEKLDAYIRERGLS